MEPQQPIPPTQEQPDVMQSAPPERKSLLSLINPRQNLKGFIAAVVLVVLIIGAFLLAIILPTSSKNQQSQETNQNQKNSATEVFKPIASYNLVYGFWDGDKSEIQVANLATGQIKELTTLPFNIKKVSVISLNSLLFINNTNNQDHGTQIASYDVSKKKLTPVVEASDGFGIDDYVLSPNNNFMALWEVSVPEGGTLSQGRSRVYAVNISNPNVKNLIYDDALSLTTPAHYPVAITDTGDVYMDTFQPNEGAGWANGMYLSNFNGSIKNPVPQIPAGSYGTQPQVSDDGNFLTFGGYDGSLGDGNGRVGTGYRRAVLIPNTIDTFNIKTGERKTIIKSQPNTIYPLVTWDNPTGSIYYATIAQDPLLSGQYLVDPVSSKSSKLNIPSSGKNNEKYAVVTSFGNGSYFVAMQDQSSSSLGNLGKNYSKALYDTKIFNASRKTLTEIPLGTRAVQYIALVPSSADPAAAGFTQIGGESLNKKQLQLQTFTLKPTLQPKREEQQSAPPEYKSDLPFCDQFAMDLCNATMGTNYTLEEVKNNHSVVLDPTNAKGIDAAYGCFINEIQIAGRGTECNDSPLYMYGQRGMSVNVKIGTTVTNSNAPYSNGYKGTLTGDGGVNIKGVDYASLDYEYASALRKLPRLTYGKTVKSEDVSKIIQEYGTKLGLNSVEIADSVKKIGKVDSKYVFVSFFDDEASKSILPITFNPMPDVYRNIVFYLKPTDSIIIADKPTFNNFERKGFTAVEVSFILDK